MMMNDDVSKEDSSENSLLDAKSRHHTYPGHDAELPQKIPAAGWTMILRRIKNKLSQDHVFIVAGGLAYYALLSIFPLLITLVSIYGLVADPLLVEAQIQATAEFLPYDIRMLLRHELHNIVTTSPQKLSLSVAASILAALWTVSSGMTSLIDAMNIVYGEVETRNYFKLRFMAFLFTIGLIGFLIISLTLVAVLPAVLAFFGFGGYAPTLLQYGRWPFLAVMVVVGLALLNRFAPNREDAKWVWVTPGALVTTVLWITLSALFSYYVSNFGNYNEVYGSLGAVIVLMLWFYLSAFVVLLGAEINAETEHQTLVDTTTGEPKPMGERGAYVADTLPRGV